MINNPRGTVDSSSNNTNRRESVSNSIHSTGIDSVSTESDPEEEATTNKPISSSVKYAENINLPDMNAPPYNRISRQPTLPEICVTVKRPGPGGKKKFCSLITLEQLLQDARRRLAEPEIHYFTSENGVPIDEEDLRYIKDGQVLLALKQEETL